MPVLVKLNRRWQAVRDRLVKAGYKAAAADYIAQALSVGDALNLDVEWREDGEVSAEEGGPRWLVLARNAHGETLGGPIGGIDLGEVGPDAHHSDVNQYDYEAEVLMEAIAVAEDKPSYRNPRRKKQRKG